jgi:7,8-dihydropterin-6-yl-methyl-4-(beta-D-ribofuranosyl)aminobenzene 5'-phosphate synthase
MMPSSLRITVLVDNNALTDRFFLAEPGLSLWIENGGKMVLFDTGFSGIFLSNGDKMGVDPLGADIVAISHGHIDHTGGLAPMMARQLAGEVEGRPAGEPDLLVHPAAFAVRPSERVRDAGMVVSEDALSARFRIKKTREPSWITPDLVFLGEIPRRFPELADPVRRTRIVAGRREDDPMHDDTALACRCGGGIVIITGCSHSGVANIIEYARDLMGPLPIIDIIGGFHLLEPDKSPVVQTCRYLQEAGVREIHPCHCTSLAAKFALSRVIPVRETGVGLSIAFGE